MSKISKLPMGTKLGLGFGCMALATAALGAASLYEMSGLAGALDRAVNQTARKIQLQGSLSKNVADMLAFERGLVVRAFLNDTAKVDDNHQWFSDRAKAVQEDISMIRPLLATEQGRHDMDLLTQDLSAWIPLHEEMWKLGREKKMKDAMAIFDQKTQPLAKSIQQTDEDFQSQQKKLLADEDAEGHARTASSRWVVITMIVLFALIGFAAMSVVRRANLDLRRMANELTDSAEQISSAAGQVAASSQSLAQGSSEQAASLEETSASTEELTSMVRKNAENSQSAAGVMTTVDSHVKDGNRTLEQMVVSMHEINASSDKISKIIKVIDEIAFQTNILALNAAVEAARAGEAGMGFAVVADEVRNLAQRSAQAAKDTASLIEESIAKSGQGSTKLQEVTDVIRAITESASKVKTLVDEVSLSSQEQSRGIDQISKAVTQMDQTTQSTAASAEESASASEELSAQAEAMKQVVHQLRQMVESGGDTGTRLPSVPVSKGKASPAAPARRSARALPSLASMTAPKVHAKLAAPAGKSNRDSFPLDDNFTEF